jgi:hypothetical protein
MFVLCVVSKDKRHRPGESRKETYTKKVPRVNKRRNSENKK